jgi:SAM-dependent methyltransferase
MHCRICDSNSVKRYCALNGYEILKCSQCGFGQVPITAEGLALLYNEDYWRGCTTAKWSQNENQPISPTYTYWLDKQLRLCPKSATPLRVLEIGPGLGGTMAGYLQEHRPDVQYEAIEISDYAADRLDARGFTIHHGGVTAPSIIEACRGRFDLIIGTEVIEHDPEPHAFAKAVHDMLKPRGWCAFTTGNLDGLISRWNKEKWYYLDPPLHVSYYTPKAFRILFQQEGFNHHSVRRYGFNYITLKLKTHIPGILLLSHLIGISTGMTVRAQRKPPAQNSEPSALT